MMSWWNRYKPIIIQVAIALAAGGLGALLSMEQFEYQFTMLEKPPLSPPMWLFPVVWSILYVLMGIAAGLIVREPKSEERTAALRLYYIQLVLNLLWPVVFFRFGLLTVAAIWLVVLIGAILRTWQMFRRLSSTAGWLLVPYLVWCLFALYLNIGFVILN